MTFSIKEILKSKQAFRERLAARSHAEKLRLLEQLRERSLTIARCSLSGKEEIRPELKDTGEP